MLGITLTSVMLEAPFLCREGENKRKACIVDRVLSMYVHPTAQLCIEFRVPTSAVFTLLILLFSLPHVTQSLKSPPKQGRNEKSMELGAVSRKYLNVSPVKNKKYDFSLVTYILCLYPLIPTKEPLHQQSPSQELPHVLPSFAKATRRTTLAGAIRTSGLT